MYPHDERNLCLPCNAPDLQPRRFWKWLVMSLGAGQVLSSVIVAGIELHQLGKLNLSNHDKLQLAPRLAKHPDNVAQLSMGNLVVASSVEGHVSAIVADFPSVIF